MLGVFGLIGSIVTIVTFVLPVFLAPDQPDWVFVLHYMMWMNGVLILLTVVFVALFIRANRRLRKNKREEFAEEAKYGDVANHLEAISAKRSNTMEYLFSRVTENGGASESIVENTVYEHCLFVIDNLCEIFSTLTKHKCSVSIKILFYRDEDDKSSGTQYVYTYARNSLSEHERGRIDRILTEYPYADNSAFGNILDPERPDFFINNDLKSLGNKYKNSDKEWNKYYNAVAVVPIKKPHGIESLDTAGFLCVDNMHGGFNEAISKGILLEVSYSLYTIYNLLCSIADSLHVPRRANP